MEKKRKKVNQLNPEKCRITGDNRRNRENNVSKFLSKLDRAKFLIGWCLFPLFSFEENFRLNYFLHCHTSSCKAQCQREDFGICTRGDIRFKKFRKRQSMKFHMVQEDVRFRRVCGRSSIDVISPSMMRDREKLHVEGK